MSEQNASSGSGKDAIRGLAIIAAIICAFAGYAHGEWIGAATAAVVAYGGIYIAFAALAWAIRVAAGAVVLILLLAALADRWAYIEGLFR